MIQGSKGQDLNAIFPKSIEQLKKEEKDSLASIYLLILRTKVRFGADFAVISICASEHLKGFAWALTFGASSLCVFEVRQSARTRQRVEPRFPYQFRVG